MSEKTQNIISNIAGLILWAIAMYLLFIQGDSYLIITALATGAVLFLYKIRESRKILDRVVDWYLGKKKPPEKPNTLAIGDDTPLPDEEIDP